MGDTEHTRETECTCIGIYCTIVYLSLRRSVGGQSYKGLLFDLDGNHIRLLFTVVQSECSRMIRSRL